MEYATTVSSTGGSVPATGNIHFEICVEKDFSLLPIYIDPRLIELTRRESPLWRKEYKDDFISEETTLEDATVEELLNELNKRLK